MKDSQRTCKKCSKQLLSNEKKYCLYCANERREKRNKILTGIGTGAMAVAVTVVSIASMGKINLKK